MFASTLAVPGLPERQAGMRVGGLYWLTCETQETADRLSRQVLAGQPGSVRAVLVNAAGSARELVATIDPAQGPGRLGLFDLKPQAPVQMILALLKDAPRVRGGDRALWVIRVSLKGWDEMVAECFDTDADGLHREAFGSCSFRGRTASGEVPAGCPGGSESADGTTLAVGWQTDRFSADIGTSPLGFEEQNILGGLNYSGKTLGTGWTATWAAIPSARVVTTARSAMCRWVCRSAMPGAMPTGRCTWKGRWAIRGRAVTPNGRSRWTR
ncbi:hypothetical protein IAE37_000984 [Pseudomonas sp. S31]|nr:hypothetical protein [Pseudomonas sp. S31]